MPLFRRRESEPATPLPSGSYRMASGNIVALDIDGVRVHRPPSEQLAVIPYHDIARVFRSERGDLTIALQDGSLVAFAADAVTATALEHALTVEMTRAQAEQAAWLEAQREAELLEARDAGGVVVQDDGDIVIAVTTVPEAKLAIRRLRLKKREYAAQKKELQAAINAIRAERRAEIAQQGSMLRGGGTFGQVVRAGQRLGRDADRRAYVQRLQPYEDAKAAIDRMVLEIDKSITTLEAFVLKETQQE